MKVFDFLCQELSIATNQSIVGKVRYDLWTSMALHDAHPAFNLSPERAATYLETCDAGLLGRLRESTSERKWRALVRKVRSFNPAHDTPEEIFARITGADKG